MPNYKHWRAVHAGMTPVALLATALSATGTLTESHSGRFGMRASSVSTSIVPGIYLAAPSEAGPRLEQALAGPGSRRSRGLEALAEVKLRTSSPGWDGGDAPRLGPGVFRRAKRFLKSLPAELAYPLVTPEEDGSIVFDWKADRDWNISVSVHASGAFGYSGLAGGVRQFGVLDADGDLPPGALTRIRSILDRSA